jgi:hypothetical protein
MMFATGVYNAVIYIAEVILETNFSINLKTGGKILGKTLSVLLVFRANSSYDRYWEGRCSCSTFFTNIRDMCMHLCVLIKGGRGQHVHAHRFGEDGFSIERKRGLDDDDDTSASIARMDVARWAVALAVGFRIHMRMCAEGYFDGNLEEDVKWKLDWDRMRLRTLLTQEEFEVVDRALQVEDTDEEKELLWRDGLPQPHVFHDSTVPPRPRDKPDEPYTYVVSMEPTYRQLMVILTLLMRCIYLHAGEPYAYKERFFPEVLALTGEIMRTHDMVHLAMVTPLPLPYVSLVRTLLVGYLLTAPLFLDYEDGVWANVVMPTMTAIALIGIDHIGIELENPFGDDANDLDVQAMITQFEREVMRMLELIGDALAREKFTWLPVPKFMQDETNTPFLRYLALKSEVRHINFPHNSGAVTGCRVRHVAAAPPAQNVNRNY